MNNHKIHQIARVVDRLESAKSELMDALRIAEAAELPRVVSLEALCARVEVLQREFLDAANKGRP